MLNNPLEEIKNRENSIEESAKRGVTPLFTKSRIYFLISVFIVVSIPLLYRNLAYLL